VLVSVGDSTKHMPHGTINRVAAETRDKAGHLGIYGDDLRLHR
jgi:hypothetical protein